MTGNQAIDYIRFEPRARFHAVYVNVADMVFLTVCGRAVNQEQIRARSYSPEACCSCCRRRLARPYLIPESLKKAKEAIDDATRAA